MADYLVVTSLILPLDQMSYKVVLLYFLLQMLEKDEVLSAVGIAWGALE